MRLAEQNMRLFQEADDAWNAQDLEKFASAHAKDVVVYVPAQPTQYGLEAHTEFAVNSFRTFPDQRVQNRPYKVFFASGDWVCSIARYTGTMTGPMVGADGPEIPPTGKSFDVDDPLPGTIVLRLAPPGGIEPPTPGLGIRLHRSFRFLL